MKFWRKRRHGTAGDQSKPYRNEKDRSYFEALEKKAEEMAKKHGCRFVDNETPYERVPKGHPIIVDYFYHEEVRGTENSGQRRTKNG